MKNLWKPLSLSVLGVLFVLFANGCSNDDDDDNFALSIASSQQSLVADNQDSATITVTLTNDNNPLAGERIDFTASSGTLSASSATTDNDGKASVTLTSDQTGTIVVEAVVASHVGTTASVSIEATAPTPAPVASLSALTSDKSTINADGSDNATITATVINTDNNEGLAGFTVTFSSDDGNLAPAATTTATTNAAGQAQVTFTSTTPGTLDITATINAGSGGVANRSVSLTVEPVAEVVTPTASLSAPSSLNVGDDATIAIKIVDQNNAALANFTADATTDLGTLSATSITTDANGEASLILTSATAGTATVAVSANGNTIGSTTVEFLAATALLTLVLDSFDNELAANGSDETNVEFIATRADGTAIEGLEVVFSFSPDNLGLTAISPRTTDATGKVNTVVTAGTQAGSVKLIAKATIDGVEVEGSLDITLIEGEIPTNFTLQLLHVGDPEIGGIQDLNDVNNFAKLLNAFKTTYTDSTVVISSGDNFLPGPATTASADPSMADLLGRAGQAYADIVMLNEMDFEVSALGNHDLDFGTSAFSEIITARDSYPGAAFPYLSSNSDFSTDSNTADNITMDGMACDQGANKLANSCVITLPNGVKVGVVGATTPTNETITNVGGITVLPANDSIAELVSDYIQPAVDALTAQGINVIILTSHMQQLPIEADQIAPLVKDVDIIIGGGSNTVLLDANDRVNSIGGTPSTQYTYPIERKDANNEDVLIVNTDGNYNYLGRLVINFSDGKIEPASYDEALSGGFSTNDADLSALDSLGLTPTENARVKEISDALIAIIEEKDGNVVGLSSVFLNGERGEIRTEETNFGDLTADANLWYARQFDANAAISLKNGGGIRTSIGTIFVPTGSTDPNDYQRLPREGNIVTQLDLENTLRFNNDLVVITVTADKIIELLEHGVAQSGPGSVPGRFPQIAGVKFSFDETKDPGSRIQNLVLVNDLGVAYDVLIENGQPQGDLSRSYRLVTLGFLANGGDGYPFGTLVNPLALEQENTAVEETVAFANEGTEQRALAEYLNKFFSATPFAIADVPVEQDKRIQQLARNGAVDTVIPVPVVSGSTVTSSQAPITLNSVGTLSGLGEIEVSAWDVVNRRIYTVSSDNPVGIRVIDMPSVGAMSLNAALSTTISNTLATALPNGYVPNSVAYRDGIIAVVGNDAADKTLPGRLFRFDASNGALVSSTATDPLPDMVTYTPNGQLILVANEGEPLTNGDIGNPVADPIGSVEIFTKQGDFVSRSTFDFGAQNIGLPNGIRIHPFNNPGIIPGASASRDVEPEYITVNAEGTRAYVSLQENNAIATIDLTSNPPGAINTFTLGVKDHGMAGMGLDASDQDGGFKIANYPQLSGMYMPDGIAHFNPFYVDGNGICRSLSSNGYLALPGEGDVRNEEERASNLDYELQFLSRTAAKNDSQLGRLEVSILEGDADGNGAFDTLYSFGSRSMAIYDLNQGRILSDTGEDLEIITELAGTRNDGRSDNKGTEPETVEIFSLPATITGTACFRTFAAVALERAKGIIVYEVTNPRFPVFVQYIETGEEPEGIKFVPNGQSPNGRPFLIVTNTDSGNVRIVNIDASGL